MKLRQVIATVVGIGIVAAVSVVGAPYAATAYWNWQSDRDASADAWASCEDPGTSVVFRAVAQDLNIDCPMEDWLGWLQEDLTRLGARPWADAVLARSDVSALARMRLNFAMWRAFDRPPRHLPALLEADSIPAAEREWMWAWLHQQEVLPTWVDVPLAQDVVGASFLADEDMLPKQWLGWLWRGTGAGGSVSPVLRAPAVQRAAQLLESAAPLMVERPLCTVDTDECVRELVAVGELSLRADARSWDGGPMGVERFTEAPELRLSSALWRAKYAEDGSTQEAAAWWLKTVASWSQGPGANSVVGALASPVASELGTDRHPGQWGDPAAVLGNRYGSPWATALAAVALGHALDQDVSVALNGTTVEISVAGVQASINACGQVQGSAELGEPVSEREVLARAAVEAAGDALNRGDVAAASRLLGLAERTEASTFAGFAQAVVDDAPTSAGQILGARIGRTTVASDRAREWVGAWSVLPQGDCPPI